MDWNTRKTKPHLTKRRARGLTHIAQLASIHIENDSVWMEASTPKEMQDAEIALEYLRGLIAWAEGAYTVSEK